MKKNILFLATLFISSGQLFGLEQRQNNITSQSQKNSLHEETANQTTGSVQSGIHNLELLAFAANFVASNSESVSAFETSNQPTSNSSSTSTQETEITYNTNETTSTSSSSSSSSSATSTQDIVPIQIDGTNPPRYKCPLCHNFDKGGKIWDINTHIRTHTGKQPFLCPHCPKKFSQQNSLNRHIRIHTGKQPFPCSKCGHKFNTKADLNRHMNKINPCMPVSTSSSSSSSSSAPSTQDIVPIEIDGTNPPLYKCPSCTRYDKGRKKGDIKRHIATVHNKTENFKCPDCQEGFYDRGNLNKHIRTHTGEQPFPCQHCLKRFSIKSNLNRHMKSLHPCVPVPKSSSSSSSSSTSTQNIVPTQIDETNPPRYKCPLCHNFDEGRKKRDIKIHIRIHTGEKPFSCSTCGHKFTTKSQLKAHCRNREKPCVRPSASSSSTSSSSTQEMIDNTSSAAGSSSTIQETEVTDEIEDDTEDENTQENTSENEL